MIGFNGLGGQAIGSSEDAFSAAHGALAISLGACGLAGSAAVAIMGAMAGTFAPATLAATNSSAVTGTLAATLAGCSMSSTAFASIAAQTAVVLEPMATMAHGLTDIAGQTALLLNAGALNAQGEISLVANAFALLDAIFIDAQASAVSTVQGSLAVLLESAGIAANGNIFEAGNFVVEDGTGRPDAESYCSVSFSDGYHAGRANSAWAALSLETKQAMLRNATDYMAQIYFGKWKGKQAHQFQALDWPRTGAWVNDFEIASTSVPLPVQRACAEFALKALDGSLSAEQGQAVKREKVGVLEVEYQDGSTAERAFPGLDRMVAPYFKTRGAGRVFLERA